MPKAEARTVAAQSVPPVDDEPLDAIQQSLARLLVDIIVAEIRAEEAAAAAHQVFTAEHLTDRVIDITTTAAHLTKRSAE
jgi:hypothetical protein